MLCGAAAALQQRRSPGRRRRGRAALPNPKGHAPKGARRASTAQRRAQAGRPGAQAPAGRSASARGSCGCATKKKAGRGAATLARAAGRHTPSAA